MQAFLEQQVRLIVFPVGMPKESPKKQIPTQQPLPTKSWKDHWGTYAQWAAFIGMVLLFLWSRYSEHAREDFELRVDERIDKKLEPGSTKLNELASRLSTVEGKIDALLAIKHIDRVGALVKKRDIASAIKEAESAVASLVAAKSARAPIPQEYFREAAFVISTVARESKGHLPMTEQLHKVAVALTEYNSAIQPQPDLTGPRKIIDTSIHTTIATRMNVRILFGVTIFPVYVHGDIFESSAPAKLSSNVVIDGPAVFIGMVPDASQTLDGIHWLNGVTFVNMRIRYKGGEVELGAVRFINCTFEFSNDPKAIEFASALASLGQPITIQKGAPG